MLFIEGRVVTVSILHTNKYLLEKKFGLSPGHRVKNITDLYPFLKHSDLKTHLRSYHSASLWFPSAFMAPLSNLLGMPFLTLSVFPMHLKRLARISPSLKHTLCCPLVGFLQVILALPHLPPFHLVTGLLHLKVPRREFG